MDGLSRTKSRASPVWSRSPASPRNSAQSRPSLARVARDIARDRGSTGSRRSDSPSRMTDDIRLTKSSLTDFAAAIFTAAGVEPAMAATWAQGVVWANLRGVDSHGVIRIPRYVDLLKKKSINPSPAMKVERRAGAIAVLDADRAPGVIGMTRAMDEAIGCAKAVHVGWCAARNVTHAGAIGYFALQAARQGMAGIVMTASGPLMAYHGARVAGVSTNPIAIAVPGKKRRPFLLDMSTSTVANGKVLAAKD